MTDDFADIRQREAAATDGPWHWFGNTKTYNLRLGFWRKGWGRCTVMDFTRWGMQSAQPRFSDDSAMMHNASEMAVWEVNRKATDPRDRSLYRHDVVGIRHPDAEFIAHARTDVPRLLAALDAVLAVCDEAEKHADTYKRACIVTTGQVRDALAGAHHETKDN